MTKQVFKVYQYPIKDKKGNIIIGSYTIKEEVEPLGFEGERLVSKFKATIYTKEEREQMEYENRNYDN